MKNMKMTKIKIDLDNLDKKIIEKTALIIKKGGVVIVPTDTVYGLIADARNEEAIRKIFKIKNRAFTKPMGIFAGDIQMAKKYVKIKKEQEVFLRSADTFVLPIKKKLPFQKNALAVRIPRSDLILAIIRALDFSLAQTSANLSGKPSTNDIEEIIKIFKNQEIQPDLILDAGKLPKRKPSKIIDLTRKKPKILRK
ncbi:threonylcarbamoyl-AMP synthase [bacterium]|nr:MAG: threonylcarbamoyl-AMP synthase [bacterium]